MVVKPLEDVRQISALTYGFIASKALFAALDLDLFTMIAKGECELDALARATGTAPNRLRTLLTALKTVGLVSETEGRFANAPAVATYLAAAAPTAPLSGGRTPPQGQRFPTSRKGSTGPAAMPPRRASAIASPIFRVMRSRLPGPRHRTSC